MTSQILTRVREINKCHPDKIKSTIPIYLMWFLVFIHKKYEQKMEATNNMQNPNINALLCLENFHSHWMI